MEVEKANTLRLSELPDPSHAYPSIDTPGRDSNGYPLTPGRTRDILERLVAQREVTLKVRFDLVIDLKRLITWIIGRSTSHAD